MCLTARGMEGQGRDKLDLSLSHEHKQIIFYFTELMVCQMSWGTSGAVNRALPFLFYFFLYFYFYFFQSCAFKTTACGGRAGLRLFHELQQFVLSDLQLPIIFLTFLEGKHAHYKSTLAITFLDYWQLAFLFISFVGQGPSRLQTHQYINYCFF